MLELYGNNPAYKFSLGGAKDCIPNNLKQTPLSVHTMLLMASMYAVSNEIYSLSWAVHQDDLIKITENEIEKIKYLISELVSDEIGKQFFNINAISKTTQARYFCIKKNLWKINFNLTVSCFDSNNNIPCGKCINTCREGECP